MRVGVVGLGRVGVVHARNAAQHPDVDQVLLLGRDDARLAVGRDAVVAAGAERGVLATSTDLGAALGDRARARPARRRHQHAQPPRAGAARRDRGRPGAGGEAAGARRGRAGGPGARAGGHGDAGGGGLPPPLRPRPAAVAAGRPRRRRDRVRGGAGAARADALGDHDTVTAVVRHASGALSTVTAARGNGAGQDVRLEISGSKASASLSGDTGVDPPYADFTERFAASFRAELDHVLRQARGEAEPLTPPSAGVAALRLAVAAEESVRTGSTVRL